MLTADKSGMAHMLGRKNHNYDAFGFQCDCCDKKDELHDLTKPPLTHFDNVTYQLRVSRAHVALWDALDEDETDDYSVFCDCCNKVRPRPTRTLGTRTRPAISLPRHQLQLAVADVHEAGARRRARGV